MLTLLLIRHASHGLLGRVLAGRAPGVSLSDAGRLEAARLAEALSGRDLARVVTSPLARARETADIIAERSAAMVSVAAEIVEIDCGTWTLQTFETLAADPRWADWNANRSTAAIPGGETMTAVQRRAMALVEGLAAEQTSTTVAFVSHADVIKSIVCAVLGLSLDRHDHFAIDPASVTTLHLWSGYGRVVRLNEAVP